MRTLIALLCLLGLPALLLATHNRAGEIIVRGPADCSDVSTNTTVRATIITYTEIIQTEVDRDSLVINWGDSDVGETIRRTDRFPIGNGIQRNEYAASHRYAGAGTYFISFLDQNRVANVENIENGSSVNIPFSVYTIYKLTNQAPLGCNSSPELSQIPIESACIGSVWTHNPGAFDVDGDSLAFEFTVPQRAPREPIANYLLPNEVGGSTSTLTINESTGQITWNAPALPGEYNLAFMVKSFRNGLPFDTLIRDMQIFVQECNNDPPELELPTEEICVVAGELIEFDVIASAPLTDVEQLVILEASGQPFDTTDNPATFLPQDSTYQTDPYTRRFSWRPNCSQVSNQPYFVVFRAEDNFFDISPVGDQQGGLSTVQSVSIRVVPPPPEDLQLVADDDAIILSWEKPYACEEQADPILLGFDVYRRLGSNPFPIDTCITGLDGRGYTQITLDETLEMDGDRYVFVDMDAAPGRTYCYRVVATLSRRIGDSNFTFEDIESLTSDEVCLQLDRDLPLLTKVDVIETDASDGQIDVCWLLPDPEALDTLDNPGPYNYVLSRADGQGAAPGEFTTVATFTTEFFGQEVDTCFTDTDLNTSETAYTYRIELFVGDDDEATGEALPGSSVFLNGTPTDEANDLSWSAFVPWTNIEYEVLRRGPGETEFTSVATVLDPSYRDEGLNNGEEYCYIISALGTYSVDNLPDSLVNRSQELCLIPVDNVPPCPPVLMVESPCDREVDCTVAENLFNNLSWTTPALECGDEDFAGYRIYFAAGVDAEPAQIVQLNDEDQLSYDDFPQNGITGCYRISAFDANGNESELSEPVCVTNCPIYELPNAFTPNGDGQNELFVPTSRCFVERVEFKIFNRWGQLVYETEDPALNWSGNNSGGDALASGTYYYMATVFEQRLDGIVPSAEPLSGYIELIRGE